MPNLFDLTNLHSELNEFQNFYKSNEFPVYSNIERPQNPFHKNFESYEEGGKWNLSSKSL